MEETTMKKQIALLLALMTALSLTACGSKTDDTETAKDPAEETTTQTPETPEEPEEPEVPEEPEELETPAFTQVNIGDTVALNGVDLELTTTQFLSGDKLGDGISVSTHSDSNQYFWLEGTIVNVGTETLNTLGLESAVSIVFDDTYTYTGELLIRNMDGLGPFAESPVYLWADVPPAMLEKYQTVKVQLGYNDGFGDYDWTANSERVVTGYTNRYEFVQSGAAPSANGAGDAAAADATAAADGTAEPAAQPIAIGDLITTNDYEFTLKKVELSYEVLPPNTSSVYTSYPAESGKVFVHVEADVKNTMQRDLRIDELFTASVLYDGQYPYDGFTIVNDGDNSFDWVGSYTAATPLETCIAHALVECPVEVDTSGKSILVTLDLGGTQYEYTLR